MFSENLHSSTGLFEGEGSLNDNLTVSYDEAYIRNLSQTDLDCLQNYDEMKRSMSFDPHHQEMIQETEIPDFRPTGIKNSTQISLLRNKVQGGYQALK